MKFDLKPDNKINKYITKIKDKRPELIVKIVIPTLNKKLLNLEHEFIIVTTMLNQKLKHALSLHRLNLKHVINCDNVKILHKKENVRFNILVYIFKNKKGMNARKERAEKSKHNAFWQINKIEIQKNKWNSQYISKFKVDIS